MDPATKVADDMIADLKRHAEKATERGMRDLAKYLANLNINFEDEEPEPYPDDPDENRNEESSGGDENTEERTDENSEQNRPDPEEEIDLPDDTMPDQIEDKLPDAKNEKPGHQISEDGFLHLEQKDIDEIVGDLPDKESVSPKSATYDEMESNAVEQWTRGTIRGTYVPVNYSALKCRACK